MGLHRHSRWSWTDPSDEGVALFAGVCFVVALICGLVALLDFSPSSALAAVVSVLIGLVALW